MAPLCNSPGAGPRKVSFSASSLASPGMRSLPQPNCNGNAPPSMPSPMLPFPSALFYSNSSPALGPSQSLPSASSSSTAAAVDDEEIVTLVPLMRRRSSITAISVPGGGNATNGSAPTNNPPIDDPHPTHQPTPTDPVLFFDDDDDNEEDGGDIEEEAATKSGGSFRPRQRSLSRDDLQLPGSIKDEIGLESEVDEVTQILGRANLRRASVASFGFSHPDSVGNSPGMVVDWTRRRGSFMSSSSTANATVQGGALFSPGMLPPAPSNAAPMSPLGRRPSWLAQPVPFQRKTPSIASPGSTSITSTSSCGALDDLLLSPLPQNRVGSAQGMRRHSVVSDSISSFLAPLPFSPAHSQHFSDARKASHGGVPLAYFLPSGSSHSQQQEALSLQNPSTNGAATNSLSFDLGTFQGNLLYTVEFKAGRTEVFFVSDGGTQGGASRMPSPSSAHSSRLLSTPVAIGDFVIVEADRGEDLGRITGELDVKRIREIISKTTPSTTNPAASAPPTLLLGGSTSAKRPGFVQTVLGEGIPFDCDLGLHEEDITPLLVSREVTPKAIHRHATQNDIRLLQAKAQEEALAMVRCQSRIRQRKLPMDIVDAEYQWDRNKLTLYFSADRRIDFRELVRDLFRIYKTRIWMCAVDRARLELLCQGRSNEERVEEDPAESFMMPLEQFVDGEAEFFD